MPRSLLVFQLSKRAGKARRNELFGFTLKAFTKGLGLMPRLDSKLEIAPILIHTEVLAERQGSKAEP